MSNLTIRLLKATIDGIFAHILHYATMPQQTPKVRYEQPKPPMTLGCALCDMICSDGPPIFKCSQKCKGVYNDETPTNGEVIAAAK